MSDQRYKGRELVGIKEACMLAGVSRRTIYNWINAKKIEVIRTASGMPRIFLDTLFREQKGEVR